MELIGACLFSREAVLEVGFGRYLIEDAVRIGNTGERETNRAELHRFRDDLIAPANATEQSMPELEEVVIHAESNDGGL